MKQDVWTKKSGQGAVSSKILGILIVWYTVL